MMQCCFGYLARMTAMAFVPLAGCSDSNRSPPPRLIFEGLVVSGSLADARANGFTNCIRFTTEMRCRRTGVMFGGFGPFSAAVDLDGYNGDGGFDQLTLWHDLDQNAAIPLVYALERQGWRSCFTGDEMRGDQGIYTHPNAAVRISMDLSYWGKRRLRIIPQWNNRERRC
jgi:hypothetical protein